MCGASGNDGAHKDTVFTAVLAGIGGGRVAGGYSGSGGDSFHGGLENCGRAIVGVERTHSDAHPQREGRGHQGSGDGEGAVGRLWAGALCDLTLGTTGDWDFKGIQLD